MTARVAALPRPIGLLGYGEEGRATLQFLLQQGIREVSIFDREYREDPELGSAARASLKVHSGAGYSRGLEDCGTVFRSPGVRPDLPHLEKARRQGTSVTSATRFFLAVCPARTIGVTGTVGKGTTVALIGEALHAGGISYRLGGNLGLNPLAFLDGLVAGHVVVLELSSFQLMDLTEDQPHVAVILRTSVEHLDWHRDRSEYLWAKGAMVAADPARQRLVCCADSGGSKEIAGRRLGSALTYSLKGFVPDGLGIVDGQMIRFRGGISEPICGLETPALPGRFNLENLAAALLAVEQVGLPMQGAVPAMASFRGLPHRLEALGTVNGVECVNDSYATRPDATLAALETYARRPLALILGGSEKHADFSALMDSVCRHPTLRHVSFMGATAERMSRELQAAAHRLALPVVPHQRFPAFDEAFAAGMAACGGDGVLLLSPACASFGLFPNYKVRGERFRTLVEGAREGWAARAALHAP